MGQQPQSQGRVSDRSDTARWNDPTYWQGIVTEGNGEQLASEAEKFMRLFETNLPKDMRPGFTTLESVLLDVCRNAPANVIRESERAIA